MRRSSMWRRLALPLCLGVAFIGYKLVRQETSSSEITEYTNRITDVIQSECPSYTRTAAYDLAVDFRDSQARGNAKYCSENVNQPMPQSEIDACLSGPPKGYAPLSRVTPIVRGIAQMTCRR